jgi:hypothetical protein
VENHQDSGNQTRTRNHNQWKQQQQQEQQQQQQEQQQQQPTTSTSDTGIKSNSCPSLSGRRLLHCVIADRASWIT